MDQLVSFSMGSSDLVVRDAIESYLSQRLSTAESLTGKHGWIQIKSGRRFSSVVCGIEVRNGESGGRKSKEGN